MKIIIIGISSDIGTALAENWIKSGHQVFGTYMTESAKSSELSKNGVELFQCDINNRQSTYDALAGIIKKINTWDVLVMCPATQKPVGRFIDTDFEEWEKSININFTAHFRIVRYLLPHKNKQNKKEEPIVLFFAGGGTNNATLNYSAYTISKIAQTKMCELLDAEIPDARFVILGPGWVKTKIHQATIDAKEGAGNNFQQTIEKFSDNKFTPMQKVVDFCNWAIQAPRQVVSGRNFSVVYDLWGTTELSEILSKDHNMYKLRRQGNDWKVE